MNGYNDLRAAYLNDLRAGRMINVNSRQHFIHAFSEEIEPKKEISCLTQRDSSFNLLVPPCRIKGIPVGAVNLRKRGNEAGCISPDSCELLLRKRTAVDSDMHGSALKPLGFQEVCCDFGNIIQILQLNILVDADVGAVVGTIFGLREVPKLLPQKGITGALRRYRIK